jgi:hypothetical protein
MVIETAKAVAAAWGATSAGEAAGAAATGTHPAGETGEQRRARRERELMAREEVQHNAAKALRAAEIARAKLAAVTAQPIRYAPDKIAAYARRMREMDDARWKQDQNVAREKARKARMAGAGSHWAADSDQPDEIPMGLRDGKAAEQDYAWDDDED